MVDIQDKDLALLVVDSIPDEVLTTSRAPQAFERSPKRRTYAAWLYQQGSVDELPGREGCRSRKVLAQCPPGSGRQHRTERLRRWFLIVSINLVMRLVHEPAAAP